jgi:hypothetical protein
MSDLHIRSWIAPAFGALAFGLGSAAAAVETTSSPQVSQTTAPTNQSVDSKQIRDLPIGGRKASDLLHTTPGSASDAKPVDPTWYYVGFDYTHVSAQNTHANLYQVGGAFGVEATSGFKFQLDGRLGDIDLGGPPSSLTPAPGGSHFTWLGQGAAAYNFRQNDHPSDVGVFVGGSGFGGSRVVGGGPVFDLRCPRFALQASGGYFSENFPGGHMWGGSALGSWYPKADTAIRIDLSGLSHAVLTQVPNIITNPTGGTSTGFQSVRSNISDFSIGARLEQKLGRSPFSVYASYRHDWLSSRFGHEDTFSIGFRLNSGLTLQASDSRTIGPPPVFGVDRWFRF